MKVIVDRIEENIVILEVLENMIDVDKRLFPDACEGDVFIISKDIDETKKRKENINNLVDNLFI